MPLRLDRPELTRPGDIHHRVIVDEPDTVEAQVSRRRPFVEALGGWRVGGGAGGCETDLDTDSPMPPPVLRTGLLAYSAMLTAIGSSVALGLVGGPTATALGANRASALTASVTPPANHAARSGARDDRSATSSVADDSADNQAFTGSSGREAPADPCGGRIHPPKPQCGLRLHSSGGVRRQLRREHRERLLRRLPVRSGNLEQPGLLRSARPGSTCGTGCRCSKALLRARLCSLAEY